MHLLSLIILCFLVSRVEAASFGRILHGIEEIGINSSFHLRKLHFPLSMRDNGISFVKSRPLYQMKKGETFSTFKTRVPYSPLMAQGREKFIQMQKSNVDTFDIIKTLSFSSKSDASYEVTKIPEEKMKYFNRTKVRDNLFIYELAEKIDDKQKWKLEIFDLSESLSSHYHKVQTQIITVLEGEMDALLEGAIVRLKPLQSVTILPNVVHALRPVSTTVRFLSLTSPIFTFPEDVYYNKEVREKPILECKSIAVEQLHKIKLMTLNIWGGYVHIPLLEFIKSHKETDIFCFQEVYKSAPHKISRDEKIPRLSIFSEIEALLPFHQAYFKPVVKDFYGLAMFVKKGIEVLNEGSTIVHENLAYEGLGPTHSRYLQWVKLKMNNQIYTIMNIHGLWNGRGKTDTAERLMQSTTIREFMETITTPIILCGDFNLRPDTKSMEILEKGMNNLIKTYSVQSTRTSMYDKEEKHADYILTSPKVIVKNFEVLKDEVSDHSPLVLEFYVERLG